MRRKSVLIIDDDDSIGAALTARLEAGGYTATYVQSGRAALTALAVPEKVPAGSEADAHHDGNSHETPDLPDLIILDVRMPDLDGIEICSRLRAEPRTRRIPVVFLTANTRSHERNGAMALLADATLTKPYNGRELVQTLDKLTGKLDASTSTPDASTGKPDANKGKPDTLLPGGSRP